MMSMQLEEMRKAVLSAETEENRRVAVNRLTYRIEVLERELTFSHSAVEDALSAMTCRAAETDGAARALQILSAEVLRRLKANQ